MRKVCGLLSVVAALSITLVAFTGLASGAPPDPKNFVAVLGPECPQAENNWRGVAVFHVRDGVVEYRIVVNNVSAPVVAGHIHSLTLLAEQPGTLGVVQDLAATGTGNGLLVTGTFTNPTLVSAMQANPADFYVNLHTDPTQGGCFIPGAVRGPIQAAPPG
jgi:hypothetical protein